MSHALMDFKSEQRWVAWRNEKRGDNLTKVPYCEPDRKAESDNCSTWMSHDRAAVLAGIIANGLGGGTGIVLGKVGDVWLAAIDLDTCRDPATGLIAPWAQAVLDRLRTYYEVSPSGTGVKAFVLVAPGIIDQLLKIMGTRHGRKFKQANGGKHPPAIELQISNGYYTVTWEAPEDAPTELRLVELEDWRWLLEEMGPKFAGKASAGRVTGDDPADTVLARLNRSAAQNKAINTALRNAATLKGGSRSEGAFGLGAALRRAGWSFADMKAALLACPVTREWATEQLAEGDRQFQRIWEKAAASRPLWPAPLDFFPNNEASAPELSSDHVPAAIWAFSKDAGERMGVDPTAVALGALVSCASVISDEWRVQPKRHDTSWTENARLWVAIVGNPSILKTPVISACTGPIDRLDAEARKHHQVDMRDYKAKMAAWKASGSDTPEPERPKLERYLVEGTTVEALSEVLRDDNEALQYAPAKKVLVRHDEMAEFIANMDRYRPGGRGGGDRGAYLRLYNGGRYTIDRISRGSFSLPNWSACFLCGIQPEPIQRIARDMEDDGLLQRFAYCVPGICPPGVDRRPDTNALQRYEGLFSRLIAQHPQGSAVGGRPEVVVLHEEAHQYRKDIDALARAMQALPDTSPRLQAAFGKWPGLFARLCLTFHRINVADALHLNTQPPHSNVVPQATARQVADLMYEILLPHLLRAESVMFGTVQTTHAQWIAGHILAHRLDRITVRDVVRAYSALRSPEARGELSSVMDGLVTIGWLEPEGRKNNQVKPVVAWSVNPAVHTVFEARAEREREQREKTRERLLADIDVLRRKRRTAKG